MVFLPHWPKQTKLTEQILLGTERVQKALDLLGNPEQKVPPVIHIAGTNGKGSTASYISRILTVAGYRTHVYTSPHLIDFNERIVLNGNKISDAMLFQVLEECRLITERHGLLLTLFEATTVAAFLAFASVDADFLILEVGMGGRLDATNVIAQPLLSVITSISYDHCEFLGDNLPAIAFEKAGIIKPNVPCVIGRQSCAEVITLLDAYSRAMNSTAMIYGQNWLCRNDDKQITFCYQDQEIDFAMPSLRGKHQVDNAGNAIAAAMLLNETQGLKLTSQQITQGLTSTYWPARLELINSPAIRGGMPPNWVVYLDGAHNNGGAEVLAQWLKDNQYHKRYLILGMTRGKDVKGFLSAFGDSIDFVCGVCVHRELNAQRGEVISHYAKELAIPTDSFDYLPSAIDYIIEKEDRNTNVCILICGSLYLASDIKRIELGLLV